MLMSDLIAKGCGWVPPHKRSRKVQESHEIILSDLVPFATRASYIKDSGRGKTVLVWKSMEKVFGSYPYTFQTIGDCFVAGTMVHGEQVKPIEEVEVGDTVYNAFGKKTKVVSTRKLKTTKQMVRVKITGKPDITCTLDHKFLVYRMQKVSGKRVTRNYYERALNENSKGFSKSAVVTVYENRKPEWVCGS